MSAVNGPPRPRTRRAQKAEATAQRIIAAARDLFTDPGYSEATIEAIAERADVAVETVYSRFKNKTGLLSAVLGTTATGSTSPDALLASPEYAAVAESRDQREQIRLLAAQSRRVLERISTTYTILESAGSRDARAALEQQAAYRMRAQRRFIDLILANGPLREGLSPDDAGATYASLSSPTNYRMLTGPLGWSGEKFEAWLAESLTRLLLPGP